MVALPCLAAPYCKCNVWLVNCVGCEGDADDNVIDRSHSAYRHHGRHRRKDPLISTLEHDWSFLAEGEVR